MSSPNIELVRRFIDAYNGRDLAALEALSAPDFEFLPYLATLIESTVYRGPDGLRRYFEDADSAWETIHVRVDEIREVGARTLSFGELYGKGRASGLEVRTPLAWVGDSRDGKLVRVETFASRAQALKAVGLVSADG